MATNRTFTMIKPDAVANGHIGNILAMITNGGFKIVSLKLTQLTVALRPILSPKCPKTAEPIGLAKKAIEKVANDSMVEVVGSEPGKNNCGKTKTAALA